MDQQKKFKTGFPVDEHPGGKERIHLSLPHMGGEELHFIQDAFTKNWIAPLGENVNGFEKDLATYTGMKYAGVFTSGTASIHLALMLLNVQPGDEVICQSFTFAATANPIRYQKAIPVFIDSEAETSNMDPVLLEMAIKERIKNGKKPKAIIVVHLYGMPAKMDRILQISEEYGIPVIEDAAEALGSHIENQKCGSFGVMSAFSFNGNKIITTSGGGALLGNSEEFMRKARYLATQARENAPHYEHSEVGYNYRMSNILAGIGRGQMRVLEQRVNRRRQIFKRYMDALGGTYFNLVKTDPSLNGFAAAHFRDRLAGFDVTERSKTGLYFIREPEGYRSNRWLTTVVINPRETGGVGPGDVMNAMHKENIEVRPLWKPMHMQPVFREYPAYRNGFSEWMFRNGLCLPSGSGLTDGDVDRVVDTLLKAIRV